LPVVVVATFHPSPGRTDELVEAITSAIPAVHAEDGCELYALHRGEDRLVMIEKWASREALATHSRGAALAELGPRLQGLLIEPPEVLRLDAVPAGTPGQGQL
jgi:quinol monooxygenase YgiN